MSSNLISRSTVNAFTKSFSPSADPRYSYWVSRIFFVILEIFAGHILRQWCMECDVGWYSRQRWRRLLQFLRVYIISPSTGSGSSAWPVGPFGFVFDYDGNFVGYDDYVVYGISYGRISPYLDNANLENCWCVTAEYEEFYGYVGIGDLRHNSYGMWCN